MRFVQITAAIVRSFVNAEVRAYAFVAGVIVVASERLHTRMYRWTPTSRGDHWQLGDMQSMYARFATASLSGRSRLGGKRLIPALCPALVLAPCTGRSCG